MGRALVRRRTILGMRRLGVVRFLAASVLVGVARRKDSTYQDEGSALHRATRYCCRMLPSGSE
jgi:hypothetical protein